MGAIAGRDFEDPATVQQPPVPDYGVDPDAAAGAELPVDSHAAILTPSETLTGTGARAGYPRLTIPAGYSAQGRAPVDVSFNGPPAEG